MLHGGIIHEIEFGQEILTGWSPVSDLIGRSMMRWRFVFAGPYFADGYTLGFFFFQIGVFGERKPGRGREGRGMKPSSWQHIIPLSSDEIDYRGISHLLISFCSVTMCTT